MANHIWLSEIKEILDEDKEGDISNKTFRRFVFIGLVESYQGLEEIKGEIKKIRENPLVALGNFIRKHPRIFISVLTFLFIIANLWFVSGLRRSVLILLHVPIEIVDYLAPAGTQYP